MSETGSPATFLGTLAVNVTWSPKGDRLVYHTREAGDPIYVADADGENGRVIARADENSHQHYQAWSTDERWIYFVRGVQSTYQWDLYRVAVDNKGEEPERLTNHDSEVGYPTPIDVRTILYVAKDQDGSGPWLWAVDVEQKRPRRLIEGGLDRYTSLAASAGASTLVATAARPTASLWSVPILERLVEEKDVTTFPVPSDKAPPSITRALMPRIGREALFFLSSGGEGDGLWRVGLRSTVHQDGEPVELWNGAKGALHAPPAISSDGRSVIVLRIDGKLRLHVISTDGASHLLTDKLDAIGTASWSHDDKWVVTGGSDVAGNEGLFKVPVGGGEPIRIVPGTALNPVWSPSGDMILYSGKNTGPLADLYAVRPDSTPIKLPRIQLRVEGERYRFLPGRTAFVYMQGYSPAQDFYLFDLATNKPPRRLTRLSGTDTMRTFDITPDGKRIVFDRVRDNSDIVLIDLKR